MREAVEAMLKRRGIDPSFLGAYDEPGRYYHGWHHIEDVLTIMGVDIDADEDLEKVLAAVFHDAVYVPGEPDNEELSARLFDRTVTSALPRDGSARVRGAITDTKDHVVRDNNPVSAALCEADMHHLRYADIYRLVADEHKVMREFQRFPYAKYREGRLTFLEGLPAQGYDNPALPKLTEIVRNRRVRVAVLVHGDRPGEVSDAVLQRLEGTFDKVVLATCGRWVVGKGGRSRPYMQHLPWNFLDDFKSRVEPGVSTIVISTNDSRHREAMLLHDELLKDGRFPVLMMPEHLAGRKFSDEEIRFLL